MEKSGQDAILFTRTAEYSIVENNILHCRMLPDVEVDVADIEENLAATLALTLGKRYVVLVDARDGNGMTKDAMERVNQPKSYLNLIAQGIVVTSLANRLIANFIIRFHKPSSPTQLFPNEEQALAWLREHLAADTSNK
jgi:hypothetical protein